MVARRRAAVTSADGGGAVGEAAQVRVVLHLPELRLAPAPREAARHTLRIDRPEQAEPARHAAPGAVSQTAAASLATDGASPPLAEVVLRGLSRSTNSLVRNLAAIIAFVVGLEQPKLLLAILVAVALQVVAALVMLSPSDEAADTRLPSGVQVTTDRQGAAGPTAAGGPVVAGPTLGDFLGGHTGDRSGSAASGASAGTTPAGTSPATAATGDVPPWEASTAGKNGSGTVAATVNQPQTLATDAASTTSPAAVAAGTPPTARSARAKFRGILESPAVETAHEPVRPGLR